VNENQTLTFIGAVWSNGQGEEAWAFDVGPSGGPNFPGVHHQNESWRFTYEKAPAADAGDFITQFRTTYGADSVVRRHTIEDVLPGAAEARKGDQLDRGSFDVFVGTGTTRIGIAAGVGVDLPHGGTTVEWWAFRAGAPMPSQSNSPVRWRLRYIPGSFEDGESQAEFEQRAHATLPNPYYRGHQIVGERLSRVARRSPTR
jgi:hypothetical protein